MNMKQVLNDNNIIWECGPIPNKYYFKYISMVKKKEIVQNLLSLDWFTAETA